MVWEFLKKLYASSGDNYNKASEQQHNYPDHSDQNRIIDAVVSELNGREALVWADVKISVNGYTNDTVVVDRMDMDLGDDYIWLEGPNKWGGKLKYKDIFVDLQRIPSKMECPGVWLIR